MPPMFAKLSPLLAPLLAPLPLADWDDSLRAIVPIVFMILYGIAQLLSSRNADNKRKIPKPAPPRRVPPPQEMGRAPKQDATLEETLRREVDQFLQRAKGNQPAEAPRPEPPRRAPAPPPNQPTSPLRPASAPSDPMSATRRQGAERVEPTRESVAQHVQQHIGPSRVVGEHADKLGDDVALADERMNRHLVDRFEHRLGSLDRDSQLPSTPLPTPPPTLPSPDLLRTASSASEFLVLLSHPDGIRQAIVASEILRRPDF